jgi:hypothetical protein
MRYKVSTIIGDDPVENQRLRNKKFIKLGKAIQAARQQHAETVAEEHYTIVITNGNDVFFLAHQGDEYTQISNPTAIQKAYELGEGRFATVHGSGSAQAMHEIMGFGS